MGRVRGRGRKKREGGEELEELEEEGEEEASRVEGR